MHCCRFTQWKCCTLFAAKKRPYCLCVSLLVVRLYYCSLDCLQSLTCAERCRCTGKLVSKGKKFETMAGSNGGHPTSLDPGHPNCNVDLSIDTWCVILSVLLPSCPQAEWHGLMDVCLPIHLRLVRMPLITAGGQKSWFTSTP